MRVIGVGHLVFAFAMIGLGVLTLVYGDFALQWQPVPEWVPWREGVAYASGAILLVGGVSLLLARTASASALVLTIYLLVTWVLPQIIQVAPSPGSIGAWLGFCETLAVTSGGWILCALLLREDHSATKPTDGDPGIRVARLLFGACCVVFGLSHFVYADFTASMIPQWLPGRLVFAYLTGAGHLAAGIGILFAIVPRLAAMLEALMMSSFVFLVHIPSIGSVPPLQWAPTNRVAWTALLWASALAASAWTVASSLHDHRWGLVWTGARRPTA